MTYATLTEKQRKKKLKKVREAFSGENSEVDTNFTCFSYLIFAPYTIIIFFSKLSISF